MEGSELGFALGFGPPVDHGYLGLVGGAPFEVFVINDHYGPIRSSARLTSAWEGSRVTLRNQYRQVFKNSMYSIYARNNVPPRTEIIGWATIHDKHQSIGPFRELLVLWENIPVKVCYYTSPQ
jgi:hypothetical protein